MDKKQHFSALLEQYAFAVAANVIDSASPSEQTRLINFLNKIEQVGMDNDLPDNSGKPCIDSPFRWPEQQWQSALYNEQRSPSSSNLECIQASHQSNTSAGL